MDEDFNWEAAYQTASNDRVRLLGEVERLTNVLREVRGTAFEEYTRTGFDSWTSLYLFVDAALDVDGEGRTEPLPGAAKARNTDPSTSHLAAASIDDLAERHYAVCFVLDVLGNATDQELEAGFEDIRIRYRLSAGPQSDQSIRSRRHELADAGHVRWTGEYRKTRSGRKAKVWEAIW